MRTIVLFNGLAGRAGANKAVGSYNDDDEEFHEARDPGGAGLRVCPRANTQVRPYSNRIIFISSLRLVLTRASIPGVPSFG
jgi:hypothetical protein